MHTSINYVEEICDKALKLMGFSQANRKYITTNLIEAEITGNQAHGVKTILTIKKYIDNKTLKASSRSTQVSQGITHMYIDAQGSIGYPVVYESLERSMVQAKKYGLCIVGIKNLGYTTGYLGDYARRATESDLILIGFNKAPASVVPYGATSKFVGTNPLVVGIPHGDHPFILDMSCSVITFSDLVESIEKGNKLPHDVAVDHQGDITNDPQKALIGGLLPIFGHKGSGIAMAIELLAGAVLKRPSHNEMEWGITYILVNPYIFLTKSKYEVSMEEFTENLKSLPKANGFNEIYYPGERSSILRLKAIRKNKLEVDNILITKIKQLV